MMTCRRIMRFKVSNKLDRLAEWYARATRKTKAKPRSVAKAKPSKMNSSLTEQAAKAIKALDQRGAWVEKGEMRHYPGRHRDHRDNDVQSEC